MFIEKINKELLDEIKDAFYGEHSEAVSNWDGELIDLQHEDFDETIRSQIFSDYLNIPLHMLADMINEHFPFLKEKNIYPDPVSEIIISAYDDDRKEVKLRVCADVYSSDREMLSETECGLLDQLLGELTKLYEELEIDTTLYIRHIPIEDVPEDYYHQDEDEHDFVLIEFN